MIKSKRHIQTGIAAVPRVNHGTHICHFFKNREELTSVIVPFIRRGLLDNEKCIWVTADPISCDEARLELNKTGISAEDYIDSGQLLIVDHSNWYTHQGKFQIGSVLPRWIEAESVALDEGYTGLRAVGVMSWILPEDRDNTVLYESEVDSVLRKHQMVALCSYPLGKLTTDEVIDMVANHAMVIINRKGGLMAIGNSRLAKICVMKGSGHSYAAIGNELGISRQRACQILNGKKKLRVAQRSMLNSSEAASMLSIHINTLRRWSNLGLLPVYRLGSRGDRRFKRKDIDNLVRTGVSNHTQRGNAESEI